jgi:hypothetical protein
MSGTNAQVSLVAERDFLPSWVSRDLPGDDFF